MRRHGESGVVLIQVAVAIVALLGFCGMVIDLGVLATARTESQNAADAGALAGAATLAFDRVSLSADAAIRASALSAASANQVWNETPVVTPIPVYEGSTPQCTVPGVPPPPIRVHTCVTVRVYRNQEMNNPIPTFFVRIVNVMEQGVKAEATAAGVPANGAPCLWPIAIPDRWGESMLPWSAMSTFVPPGDTYSPPTTTLPNEGFQLADLFSATKSLGMDLYTLTPTVPLTLTQADFTMPLGVGRFVRVVVPRADGGGFASNLNSCNGIPMFVYPGNPPSTGILDLSAGTAAEVVTAAQARRDADPGATWDTPTRRVIGSCVTALPCPASAWASDGFAAISPRLVALPVFNVARYEATRLNPGGPEIRISNFVGFFIETAAGSTITGRLTTYPGVVRPGLPAVGYISSFLRAAILRR